jgi:hypothetical protein
MNHHDRDTIHLYDLDSRETDEIEDQCSHLNTTPYCGYHHWCHNCGERL